MKIEINLPNIQNFIKDIQKRYLEKASTVFQMVHCDVRKSVGKHDNCHVMHTEIQENVQSELLAPVLAFSL